MCIIAVSKNGEIINNYKPIKKIIMRQIFLTKNEAIKYFGHTWQYIKKYYEVQMTFNGHWMITKIV